MSAENVFVWLSFSAHDFLLVTNKPLLPRKNVVDPI